ncbi:helix-turn-helix domain-containing protein [Burkholderia anthina]|uniref:helix-turn-helix domain-containing protein n=1 Tax=Burkholderia anthina TaxID=179879 RepID=UPI00158AF046|nr:helix-turn-helix domain-containing protein [Burkholderia anthina]
MENHFNIAEAAAILHMTDAALLRACLDEQIELSIRFSGRNLPYGKLRRQLPMEAGYPVRRVKTASLGLYDMPFTLGVDRSLWTLVMAGSGRLCVEDEYQRAIGRIPAVSDFSPSSRLGVFVSSPDISMDESGYVMLYELVEYQGTASADAIHSSDDFHATHTFPSGAELVISETAISGYRTRRLEVEHQSATGERYEAQQETPEQYRVRVAEAVKRNNNNKAAAARELGISRQRVSELVGSKNQKSVAKKTANTAHDPFAQIRRKKANNHH